VRRSRRLRLQTRINPVLVALLLAWSADGALADPGSSSADNDEGTSLTPYLVVGAVAAGFAATYALLLGGNDRSYSRSATAATDGTSAGTPPQQPGAPGGTDTPGGTETPGGTSTPEDSPTTGAEVPGVSAPATSPTPTSEAPEPGTLLLLGAGAAALFATRSRRGPRSSTRSGP